MLFQTNLIPSPPIWNTFKYPYMENWLRTDPMLNHGFLGGMIHPFLLVRSPVLVTDLILAMGFRLPQPQDIPRSNKVPVFAAIPSFKDATGRGASNRAGGESMISCCQTMFKFKKVFTSPRKFHISFQMNVANPIKHPQNQHRWVLQSIPK